MTRLFVDGYNVIGAWPELIELKDDRLEDAREYLIDVLSEFAATSQWGMVIVFDGHQVKGNRGTEEHRRGIDIVYTSEGVTADMVIERLVAHLPPYEDCYVASSDRLVQETILYQGALRISANELRQLVRSEKEGTRKRMASLGVSSTLDEHLSPEVRKELQSLIFLDKGTPKKRKKSDDKVSKKRR